MGEVGAGNHYILWLQQVPCQDWRNIDVAPGPTWHDSCILVVEMRVA